MGRKLPVKLIPKVTVMCLCIIDTFHGNWWWTFLSTSKIYSWNILQRRLINIDYHWVGNFVFFDHRHNFMILQVQVLQLLSCPIRNRYLWRCFHPPDKAHPFEKTFCPARRINVNITNKILVPLHKGFGSCRC